jgi:hypothetical protein
MSHHCPGRDRGFPNGDARLDLTDLYALPSGGIFSASPHCIQSLHFPRMLLTISVMLAFLQLFAQSRSDERNKP